VSTATLPDLANPERMNGSGFGFSGLVTTEEEAATVAEARIHDVRELRTEGVPQLEEPKVLIGCRELAALKQDVLLGGACLGYRQLIMDQANTAEEADR